MIVHLVDGTYELFRQFYGQRRANAGKDKAYAAVNGVLHSILEMFEQGATHLGVATDHVIESFRNDLFAGYKTGVGLPIELTSQFALAERAAHALGFVVWPMVDFEADDALATGAARWADDPAVDQIRVCTPDKDLAQCVRANKVVGYDRFKDQPLDEDGVRAKFGVGPASIPDFLALVGDTADGIPGLPRWGEKSAAQVLARWGRLEAIPDDPKRWEVPVRGADALATSLRERREDALLYRTLATLRSDAPLSETLADLERRGARRAELEALCAELEEKVPTVPRWRDA